MSIIRAELDWFHVLKADSTGSIEKVDGLRVYGGILSLEQFIAQGICSNVSIRTNK